MVIKGKVLSTITLNKRGEKQIATQFYKTRKERMTKNEFTQLVDDIRDKGELHHKNFRVVLMRVQNGTKWASFTDWDKFEEYYEGKVKDESKFMDFSQVQITVAHS